LFLQNQYILTQVMESGFANDQVPLVREISEKHIALVWTVCDAITNFTCYFKTLVYIVKQLIGSRKHGEGFVYIGYHGNISIYHLMSSVSDRQL